MSPVKSVPASRRDSSRSSTGEQRWFEATMPHGATPSTEGFGAELLPYVDALYNFARHLSRDPHNAEDLVQETFLRALAARAQFRPGSNLKAWVFCILRNAHLDLVRRRTIQSTDADAELAAPDGEAELLRGDIEIDRLRGIVSEQIETALDGLSADGREAILLDLEEFNEAEMAEMLGCATGTVKSRLARARAALRKQLREYAK